MNQWTPQNITALIVAIGGVLTALGALRHSTNTRREINGDEEKK